MKTYLVTGGAGFIGSNFVIYMLNKYSDVKIINVDKLTYAGNLENLKSVESNPELCLCSGGYLRQRGDPERCLTSTPLITWSTLPRKAMWTAASPIRRFSSRPMFWAPSTC